MTKQSRFDEAHRQTHLNELQRLIQDINNQLDPLWGAIAAVDLVQMLRTVGLSLPAELDPSMNGVSAAFQEQEPSDAMASARQVYLVFNDMFEELTGQTEAQNQTREKLIDLLQRTYTTVMQAVARDPYLIPVVFGYNEPLLSVYIDLYRQASFLSRVASIYERDHQAHVNLSVWLDKMSGPNDTVLYQGILQLYYDCMSGAENF